MRAAQDFIAEWVLRLENMERARRERIDDRIPSSKMRSSSHRANDMPESTERPGITPPVDRRPYRDPVLRVFGSVAAITATTSMDGQAMDGGPNNIKT